ncbi:Aspartate/prephenate aminotransferase [Usitatibacter rugosus]|uniref:Aspartate/prephenate aminotransferase n=1 Tax=Usitatibacter rugosus TaxID=2732067 RepID=A0A6M4GTP2_9PROT|nr:pyridoxal phosphate-dependent aminotransferase [Usitatibacter rugosus]QJR10486.1 Aspartate/prephenate aminotransferase [Usitatibacter rugosus]
MDRKTLGTRMDAVQTPIIPTIGAMVRATPGCISLGQGVVHYPPPRAALEAAAAAVTEPTTSQYQPAAGIPRLLERITAKLAAENGIHVGRDVRVMVTAGGNMAFCHALDAITQPGDEIIVNTPYYFNHEMAIRIAGCVPVCVPTDERYQPRVDALRAAITDRTRAIVTVTPNNPTGAVYPEATLRAINALCGERGIYHVCDEPYEYFTYGGARHFSGGSIAGAEKHTLSIFSLSKAFGFAGWRTGYMAYPEHLEGAMLKIQDTMLICPPVVTQIAAAACLEAGRGYAEPFVKDLAEVRELVLERLGRLAPKVNVPPAEGAFYCFVKIDSGKDPMEIAERLIREFKVAVLPGSTFGVEGCYLRIAYGALKKETVAEGMGRLVEGLGVCI